MGRNTMHAIAATLVLPPFPSLTDRERFNAAIRYLCGDVYSPKNDQSVGSSSLPLQYVEPKPQQPPQLANDPHDRTHFHQSAAKRRSTHLYRGGRGRIGIPKETRQERRAKDLSIMAGKKYAERQRRKAEKSHALATTRHG